MILFLYKTANKNFRKSSNWDTLGLGKPGIILSPISMYTAAAQQTPGFPSRAYTFGNLMTFVASEALNDNEAYKNSQIYIPSYDGKDSHKNIYLRTITDKTSDDVKIWRVIDISSTTTSVVAS